MSKLEAIDSMHFLGISIIWQSLESVAEALRVHARTGFVNEQRPELNYELQENALDLGRTGLGTPKYRVDQKEICVFRPLCSPYASVWIANFSDGWSSLLRFLGKPRGWVSVSLRSSRPDDANWIQEFTLVIGDRVVRCARTMWDGHPEFFSTGTPLFCEDVNRYEDPIIKDRVTRQLLVQYLGKLGLPMHLPEFWVSQENALYFRKRSARDTGSPSPHLNPSD